MSAATAYLKENSVYIRRKPNNSAFGNEVEKNYKIGGSIKNQDVLRGLNPQEEILYLAAILGVQPTDVKWGQATREYWANISKNIPDGDGLKLDIGAYYNSESEAALDKTNMKGNPKNINDYILWRYCLVYGRVANSVELSEASPKIRFYLFSELEERARKKSSLDLKLEAMKLLVETRNDTKKMKNLLVVFSKDDKSIPPLSSIAVEDYDVILDRIATETPDKFIVIANDSNLQMKAFIERAINKGILKRIANTDAIMSEDSNIIGNSSDEVVALLSSEKGKDQYEILKAKLKA